MRALSNVVELIEKGKSLVMVTVVNKEGEGPVKIGSRLIVDSDDGVYGTVGGGALEARVIQQAKAFLREKKNALIQYDLNQDQAQDEHTESVPMICGGRVQCFYEYMTPEPKLIIFGKGHVGSAVYKKAKHTGFDMKTFDDLNAYVDLARLKEKHDLSSAYVVICTGSHEEDYKILKHVLGQGEKMAYLGMLASKKKIEELKSRLANETNLKIDKLYSPIGLDLGGETADEIAIAIVAQLIAKKYNKRVIKDMDES